jgi:hypothetical protein
VFFVKHSQETLRVNYQVEYFFCSNKNKYDARRYPCQIPIQNWKAMCLISINSH